MTSKLLRLGEKLSSVQRAGQSECQHPPGALAAAASPDQHATAIRGCAGARAGAARAGGRRASTRAREEQVAAELSGGLPWELVQDQTCSLWTRSSSSTPSAGLHRSQPPPRRGEDNQEGEGAGGEGRASRAQRLSEAWKRGRGGAGEAGRGGDGAGRTLTNCLEVPEMPGWFG